VIIEAVSPEVDDGRFPTKRTVGEDVTVSADIFAAGHDVIIAVLRHRSVPAGEWAEVAMAPVNDDRWTGEDPFSGRRDRPRNR
jgi:starch synthase (maltosyl-transferring)